MRSNQTELVQFVPQESGEPQHKGVESQVGIRTMISPNRFWTIGPCPDSFELADLILSWTGEQSSPRRISVAKERPSVFRTLMTTNQSFATATLRLVLGLLFFAQSVQTMLSWFGSYGFSASMSLRSGTFSAPTEINVIVIVAEFFGGLTLIVGFLTRVVAASIAVNAMMALVMVDSNDGFFMNWSAVHNGGGFGFHLLTAAIAFFLMLQGAGAASVDHVLFPCARESYQQILDMTKTVAVGKIKLLRRL
jgi:putative oxidoreductase